MVRLRRPSVCFCPAEDIPPSAGSHPAGRLRRYPRRVRSREAEPTCDPVEGPFRDLHHGDMTHTHGDIERPLRLCSAQLPGRCQRHQSIGIAMEQQGGLADASEFLSEGSRAKKDLRQRTCRSKIGIVQRHSIRAHQEMDLGGNEARRHPGRVGTAGGQNPMHALLR